MSGKAQLIGDEMRRPGPPRTARPMRCGRCARRIRTMPRGCSAAFNGQSIARRIAAAAKAAGIEKRIQRAQRPAAGWASPASSPPGGEHHRDDACRRLEDSPHGCALLGRRHGRTGRGRQVPVTADRDDRCRHGAPACARCRRAARLRAVLAIIRDAEIGAECYLPISAADLDRTLRTRARELHRHQRRR